MASADCLRLYIVLHEIGITLFFFFNAIDMARIDLGLGRREGERASADSLRVRTINMSMERMQIYYIAQE